MPTIRPFTSSPKKGDAHKATQPDDRPGLKIALNSQEAAAALGISVRSLKRLEERGLIKSCKALRHKIYACRELERFVKDNS